MTAGPPVCYEWSMRRGFALALVVMACDRPCPRADSLGGLDGGPVACVVSTDCPRPANLLVCGSAEDQLVGCVDCVATRCVRYVPMGCP